MAMARTITPPVRFEMAPGASGPRPAASQTVRSGFYEDSASADGRPGTPRPRSLARDLVGPVAAIQVADNHRRWSVEPTLPPTPSTALATRASGMGAPTPCRKTAEVRHAGVRRAHDPLSRTGEGDRPGDVPARTAGGPVRPNPARTSSVTCGYNIGPPAAALYRQRDRSISTTRSRVVLVAYVPVGMLRRSRVMSRGVRAIRTNPKVIPIPPMCARE
jgi:hypothetical protein